MEEKNIVKQDLSPEDIKTLTEVGVIPKDCSAELVKLYAKICVETQLNPFRKQIHFIRRGNTYTVQVGIDGYRSIADRTGLYAGSDDYAFDDEKSPNKATVTVYKMVNGVRCPFTASARMSEYKPQDVKMQFMWNKMPNLMLGKCAESLALRKAFPNELSGTYTDEEMQQADSPKDKIINAKLEKPQETNGDKKSPSAQKPTPMGSSKCADCKKEITNPRVTEYSMQNFGEAVFFNCQAIRKESKDEVKDAEFSVSEFEEHTNSEDEVI